jgi:hypothetical protein
VVIRSAEAPRRFEFRVGAPDGATLRLADSGAIGVVDPSGTAIAVVEAASATDARGRPVPTHYEVEGMTISQIVDHGEDTVHPVVAYPRVSAGWFVYVRFNRQEVKDFASRGAVVGAATLMGMVCTSTATSAGSASDRSRPKPCPSCATRRSTVEYGSSSPTDPGTPASSSPSPDPGTHLVARSIFAVPNHGAMNSWMT